MSLRKRILDLLETGPKTITQIVGELGQYVSAAQAKRACESLERYRVKVRQKKVGPKTSLHELGVKRRISQGLAHLKLEGKVSLKDGLYSKIGNK